MIAERIAKLRKEMTKCGIDAFIIPSTDPHQSEYVAEYWKIRAYFSGFTGSAGILVVTQNEVALWTDARYFLQFEDECKNTEVVLHKQQVPHAPEHVAWICDILPEKSIIGLDYSQFSKAQIDYILKFANPKQITIQNEMRLVSNIWENRPVLSQDIVEVHSPEFSGETTVSKLQKVQDRLVELEADYYLISSLDELSWLFNIRSKDVDFTPLVTGYALIGKTATYLFSNPDRYTKDCIHDFEKMSIQIQSYDAITTLLPELSKQKKIVTDASSLNYAIFDAIQGTIIFENSLVKQLKMIKNSVEIKGAENCMVKDGVALTKFYIWLEKELNKRAISEYEIGEKLESFREQQVHYTGESFAAIVGYKGNGAIIHYTAPKEGSAMVKNENILLIDSGAQYKDGTTDITRTIWLGGEIPTEIKLAYTAVLKGFIELHTLRFPKGTSGVQIDAFARMHLWKNGLNYPHGTGHGVGSFGMVHEPAQGFTASTATERGATPHVPNQFTTIEPGCYVANKFGIRTENVVVSELKQTTDFGDFIGFRPLTLCYIDTQLIDVAMLSLAETTWLNNYNQQVYEKISNLLTTEEANWLQNKCQPI